MNNNIKDTTSLVFVKGKNLLNKENSVAGYRLGSDGLLFADMSFSTSDFISVEESTTYTISWNIEIRECVCYYDSNKSFIARNTSDKPFTTPSNCKYIRVSFATTRKDTAQVEQGSIATTYEPYVENQIHIKNKNGIFEEFYNEEKKPNYIKNKLVSGTPDNNGFLNSGLGLNNVILGVSNISATSGFFIPFVEKNANRLTLKCETWERNPITTSISLMVHYIEI